MCSSSSSSSRFANAEGVNMSHEDTRSHTYVEGEAWFSDRIWTPNIFIENEQSSEIMDLRRTNVFVRIRSNGNVQMNYR